jgi:hypothetical protein
MISASSEATEKAHISARYRWEHYCFLQKYLSLLLEMKHVNVTLCFLRKVGRATVKELGRTSLIHLGGICSTCVDKLYSFNDVSI